MSLWRQIRNTLRPNWIPPASPEIVLDADQIPSDAMDVMQSVNYGVQPWIFDYYGVSIPQVMELVPNEERVPWSDDQRLPR